MLERPKSRDGWQKRLKEEEKGEEKDFIHVWRRDK